MNIHVYYRENCYKHICAFSRKKREEEEKFSMTFFFEFIIIIYWSGCGDVGGYFEECARSFFGHNMERLGKNTKKPFIIIFMKKYI